METRIIDELYSHRVEIQYESSLPESKKEEIPSPLMDRIINELAEGNHSGVITPENCNESYGEDKHIHYTGSWRIIQPNFELLLRLIMWRNNYFQNESLTKDLFIQYFGINNGNHYYGKWAHEFEGNILKMICYFKTSHGHGRIFCDMMLKQVEEYEKRERII